MVIDHHYLSSQTWGDEDLQCELLGLFIVQAGQISRALDRACDAGRPDVNAIAEALHRLKGSARAIGARDVGDETERIEHSLLTDSVADSDCSGGADWIRLRACIDEACSCAESLIAERRPGALAKRHENG
jgi:HPt (histidine-containing phosphotransfer) domain-containing protein